MQVFDKVLAEMRRFYRARGIEFKFVALAEGYGIKVVRLPLQETKQS